MKIDIPIKQKKVLRTFKTSNLANNKYEILKRWIYSSGSRGDIFCTYNFFACYSIYQMQTSEIAPFWCTHIIFTFPNRRCFFRRYFAPKRQLHLIYSLRCTQIRSSRFFHIKFPHRKLLFHSYSSLVEGCMVLR